MANTIEEQRQLQQEQEQFTLDMFRLQQDAEKFTITMQTKEKIDEAFNHTAQVIGEAIGKE
jgi:hypothetical protein